MTTGTKVQYWGCVSWHLESPRGMGKVGVIVREDRRASVIGYIVRWNGEASEVYIPGYSLRAK